MSTFDKTGHQHLSAERLSEYIDGRLPLHEREGVEAQLRACAHCREEADSLRATVMLLRGVPAVPAPRSGVQRYLDKALAVLQRYGVVPSSDAPAELTKLLDEVKHVDEPKVLAVACWMST